MYYDPDEGFSASSWLATIANAIYNEYLDYWEQQNLDSSSELSEDQRHRVGLLIKLTAALKPCMHSLSLDPPVIEGIREFMAQLGLRDVDEDFAGRVLHAVRSNPIVHHGLQIELASEAADNLLAGAENRFGVLLGLIASRTLSRRAAAYLDRATRLYLWGFEPEAIIMCAAVLEAAYPERFSLADMVRLGVRKNRDDSELRPHEYEFAAFSDGVYSKAQRDLAGTIRRARNFVAHTVPVEQLTAQKAIVGTAELLSCLFPADRK